LIRIYTNSHLSQIWLERYRSLAPTFCCILGFTETALIPGISAAGATPESRRWTAIADAEYLIQGAVPTPTYPLPPLTAGVSPVIISRALIQALGWSCHVFNAGLANPPSVRMVDLGGQAAACLSTGNALPLERVTHLVQSGYELGQTLGKQHTGRYLIVSECVVGGTTTALGVLTGLGVAANGKVNSSHPECNHQQKQQLVLQGLERAGLLGCSSPDPVAVVAAVGDPMQPVVAGLTLAASQHCGVLLAGGTQMLAVYALACAIAQAQSRDWNPEHVVVGTTRWVADDPTGDTVGLAHLMGQTLSAEPPLLATQLSFKDSKYPQLQRYEQGFVKEGVGAGGCAIAASLQMGWGQAELLQVIEQDMLAFSNVHS
jgi:uncharacterized protein (TIGR00303 family)